MLHEGKELNTGQFVYINVPKEANKESHHTANRKLKNYVGYFIFYVSENVFQKEGGFIMKLKK
jgi:hypothetical protein